MATKQHPVYSVRRRSVLKAMSLAAVAGIGAPAWVRRAHAAEPLVMVSYGGSYADALKEVIADPFTKASGVPVQILNTPDLAKVKAQVTSGSVNWDIFDASGPLIMAGSSAGYWEAIDTNIVPTSKVVGGVGADRVPNYIFCGGVAWNSEQHSSKQPRNFKDLWDIEKFPGRRALRNRVSETLEMALLADGVSPKDLYPLDVERGFKALDRLKPQVRKWFEQTPQMVTLIQSKEIDWIYAYPNRIRVAQESGIPLEFSFDQTLNLFNYMAVLKGSKRRKEAMEYIAFALQPQIQANLADKLGLAPVVAGAEKLMKEASRRWLPDLNNPNNVFVDDEYWGKHYVELDKRFKEWILT
ncbi:ABC transporter substrate-binding protein [Pollutimonas bauzanensis]|uniref:Putative spermidine/putrescine transport system substrate-binding protein n=1 Tax=Pollutimonas bauzanensis TaxID=658167 RepID=A0A1M5XTN6_9BURK|nr:ABC transporter substrate-binding protein [Pollutimonas bauzanensis]SHI03167.1 putative spermidine/putrescine transport system substrate-binding protein [Pollutimonas bauzanensis]